MNKLSSSPVHSGFGLLEVILVFAILIGAAAIVFGVFHSAEASSEASNAVEQIKLVVGNLQTANQEQHVSSSENIYIYAYNDDQNGEAIRQQVFKGLTEIMPEIYQGTWGGSTLRLTLATPGLVPGLTNENSMWALMYNGVPGDACARFVMGVAPMVDVLQVNAANVPGNINTAILKPLGGQLNTAQTMALCGEIQSDGNTYGSIDGTAQIILIGH